MEYTEFYTEPTGRPRAVSATQFPVNVGDYVEFSSGTYKVRRVYLTYNPDTALFVRRILLKQV